MAGSCVLQLKLPLAAAENTPLQLKLNDLPEVIAKAGSTAGGLLFFALFVRFFVELSTHNSPRWFYNVYQLSMAC
jgi:hypothetical protein